jgi:hypothetical protein
MRRAPNFIFLSLENKETRKACTVQPTELTPQASSGFRVDQPTFSRFCVHPVGKMDLMV